MPDELDDEEAYNDTFDDISAELSMETSRDIIVIVWDDDQEVVTVENDDDLPTPMVIGMLTTALDQFRSAATDDWVMIEAEDEED